MCALSDDPSVVLDREPDEEKIESPSGPRIRCPLCGWSPRKETDGLAHAGICGTRSIREECVQRACTSGLLHSAPSVATGRSIRSGMRLREKEETVK